MQSKTVFERNIEALKSQKVKYTLIEQNITADLQVINTNGFNLTFEGKPLHNETFPLGEAKAIFETCENKPSSITIVYGIGLGYLFQYAAQNSKGTVILYEPNVDILKTAFQLVDFSNEIKSKNVYVAIDRAGIEQTIRAHFNENSYPEIICLPAYKTLFSKQIEEDSTKLNTLIGGISLDHFYTKTRFLDVTKSILKNIPYLAKEPPLCSIQNIYEGKTAVVCSAGPTLAENLETLKKYKDNVVILAVGPAYKSLLSAGITPDFLCIIEDRNCSGQIKNLDLSETSMILEPYTNIAFHQMSRNAKRVFSHISNNLPPNKIWEDITGYSRKEYISKGSVSYCALNSARILGCSRIVLLGQDLAFLGEQLYSKDSIFKDLKLKFNEELQKYEVYAENFDEYAQIVSQNPDAETRKKTASIRIANYNQKITTIRGITGELLPTEAVYTTFALGISKYAEQFKGIEYINSSMRGALIENFKNIPLEDALKDTTPINKDIVSSIELCKKSEIITKLEELLTTFKTAEEKVNESKRLLVRFRTEYIRHKSLTKEMLQTLKKVVNNYIFLSIEHAQTNSLFDFITKKEQIQFETFLQKATEIDLPTGLKLTELQTEYLDNTLKNIDDIKAIINEDITDLKEDTTL